MYILMYVCMYVYTYIYIYIYVYIAAKQQSSSVYIFIYILSYRYIHTYIYIHIHICIYSREATEQWFESGGSRQQYAARRTSFYFAGAIAALLPCPELWCVAVSWLLRCPGLTYIYIQYIYVYTYMCMGWLRLVGSL